jgi:hypothetical protein
MQIRDTKTHQPLPRIAVGDIGPKYGMYVPIFTREMHLAVNGGPRIRFCMA